MNIDVTPIKNSLDSYQTNNFGNNDGSSLEYFKQIGSVITQTLVSISGLNYQVSGLAVRIAALEAGG